MDNLTQIAKNYITPRKKTLAEECSDYIKKHPTTVAKGIAGSVAVWYIVPVAFGILGWLPYAGVSYYVYQNTSVAKNWYQWGRNWVI